MGCSECMHIWWLHGVTGDKSILNSREWKWGAFAYWKSKKTRGVQSQLYTLFYKTCTSKAADKKAQML